MYASYVHAKLPHHQEIPSLQPTLLYFTYLYVTLPPTCAPLQQRHSSLAAGNCAVQASADHPRDVMMSAGFCVAYLVFIAQNLEPMTGYRGVYFILVACPIVAAIAMLTGVRALAPFSLIADAANVLGTLLAPEITVCTAAKVLHLQLACMIVVSGSKGGW